MEKGLIHLLFAMSHSGWRDLCHIIRFKVVIEFLPVLDWKLQDGRHQFLGLLLIQPLLHLVVHKLYHLLPLCLFSGPQFLEVNSLDLPSWRNILFHQTTKMTGVWSVSAIRFGVAWTVADILRNGISCFIVWNVSNDVVIEFSWTEHLSFNLSDACRGLLDEMRRMLSILSKRERYLLNACWNRRFIESHTGRFGLWSSPLFPILFYRLI